MKKSFYITAAPPVMVEEMRVFWEFLSLIFSSSYMMDESPWLSL
jgi:hypothetical protein